jgi:sphingomyelin phosphodiesterase acid-like 3
MFQRHQTRIVMPLLAAGLLVPAFLGAVAQRQPSVSAPASLPVVMLSDVHFDPLHDPAKVPQLVQAPVSQWAAILAAPSRPGLEERFAAVQQSCKSKEAGDTPYPLLRSSLSAARIDAPAAGFVTVSGDLLVHDLDCRYRVAMQQPPSTADDQSLSAAFAEKTTVFVMEQIQEAFPHVPVYFALGNNDSRCNHNRLDFHDAYLKSSSTALLAGLRGIDATEKVAAQVTYEAAGYYGVTMPTPMANTRLVVVNDIYMMPKYANCEADEKDHSAEQQQMAWLQKELDGARKANQHVWVLGHLPPAVNPDASLSGTDSFCTSGKVVRFQTTEDLAKQLGSHADTVKLGIFGHTHMDELHLLRDGSSAVPIKVVASLTPVSGNLPSFTVAMVDPTSATLTDYVVYEASNATGIRTTWSKEYDFGESYHEASFTPGPLSDLIGRLRVDVEGAGAESRAYQLHFAKGAGGKKLSSSWSGYVCSLDNATAQGFKACVCGAR